MQLVASFILTIALIFNVAIARSEPLKIATTFYTPPFIFSTSNNHFYGFDITTMQYLCKKINRECTFVPIAFDDLLPTVKKGTIPIAINALTITDSRMKFVDFSKPYLPSECSLLVKSSSTGFPISIPELDKRTFGVVKGNIFTEIIRSLGITKARIKGYSNTSDMINALNNGDVSTLLIDSPSANFWQMESKGMFQIRGPQIPCGDGLGIAVNKNETKLLKALNQAIDAYHQSPQFHANFNQYIRVNRMQ